MVSETVNVNLTADVEARPVAVLVQKASQFESRVFIQSGDKRINAKSIMGMMSLGLSQDAEVTVSAEGEDEQDAVEGIVSYLKNVG
jgi:catabolite repression HPr-like protein